MSRGALLAAVGGLLLLVAGAALLLTQGDETSGAGSPAREEARPAGAELPSFASDLQPTTTPRAEAGAPTPLTGEPASAARDQAPGALAPAGPVRRLAGRVVRLSDGSPLGGATVRPARLEVRDEGRLLDSEPDTTFVASHLSLRLDEPASRNTVLTDEAGRFELADVAAATTALEVLRVEGFTFGPQPFEIEPGRDDLLDLLFVCDSGFSIAGRVVDAQEAPLPFAHVHVTDRGQAQADAAGRFLLRDVAPRKDAPSVEVAARAPWHRQAKTDVLVPRDVREVPQVVLRLQGSGVIAGRVTNSRREPLAGVPVSVLWEQLAWHGTRAEEHLGAVSDELGEFLVDHVPEGTWLVQAGVDAPAAEAQDAESATAPPGLVPRRVAGVIVATGRRTSLDFVLDAGATISGFVGDAAGGPLADASLVLEALTRWPGEGEGSSVTSGGAYTLTSRTEDGVSETVLSTIERRASADARGRYELAGVTSGEKRLTVRDTAGLAVPEQFDFTVAPGVERLSFDFLLPAALRVTGRITDPSGAPVAAALVHIRPRGTHVFSAADAARTDATGRYEIGGLKQGPHTLLISAAEFGDVWEQLESLPATLDRVLRPALKLHGVVTDARDDRPITVFDVRLEAEGNSVMWTDAEFDDGVFAMDVGDDAPQRVTIRADGYAEQSFADVVPSTTAFAPLRFRLAPLP